MNKVTLIHQVEQATVKLDVVRKAIMSLPELRGTASGFVNDGDMMVRAPHDYKLMAEHRKAMEKAGWKHVKEYRFTSDGTLGQFYRFENVELKIYYRPDMDGATCQIREIGTEQHPIVEVVCAEAE